jgi:MtrB/PioB family decaheme-associated outer membrane protein
MRTSCRNRKPFLRVTLPLLCALVFLGGGSAAAQAPAPAPDATAQPAPAPQPAPPAAAAAPAPPPAPAPAKAFTFHLDPLVLGALNARVDSNSAKWEEYRDMSGGFIIPKLRLTGEGTGDRELAFNVENAGREDGRYTLTYGVPGGYEFSLDYNKIPHHFGNDGQSLWTATGPGRLAIADPIQAALQGAIAAQYAVNPAGITYAFLNHLIAPYLADAQPVSLGIERDRLLARLDLGRMGPFALGVEFDHEKRTGTQAYGGSFGFGNATELPAPVDYDTTGAELAGEWNTRASGVTFGYRFSSFDNNISTLIYDNPFRATDSTDPAAYTGPGAGSIGGPVLGLADLPASNRSDVLFVNGRTRFGTWFATGSGSYDSMRQDDPLLPYTLNSAISGINFNGSTFDPTNPSNLPTRTADRRTDATALNADLGTRFGQSLELTFRYRYYDLSNKSPRVELPGYVLFDAVWQAVGLITVPYSYTRQNSSAELGWDLSHATRLAMSFERETWDRAFSEISNSDENIWKATFDSRPAPWFSLRSSYQYGDRSTGRYDINAAEADLLQPSASSALPGLLKYDEAPRKQHLYNVQAQLFPSDAWNFFAGVVGNDQNYDQSAFGLEKDDSTTYNAELSYAPGDDLNVFLFASRQDSRVFQGARQSGAVVSTDPLDSWTANLTEVTDTWGAGLTAKLARRWSLDLSANWSRSNGTADLFSPPGGTPDVAVGFNNYDDVKLLTLLGRINYQINPAVRAGLFGRWEDYRIDSFALQGLETYLPGALLLDPNAGNYRGSLVGADMTFTF